MSQPPRSIERVIESFGTDKDFRDAVVGDLAEEFASRAVYDGERDARRWYYREATRVIPALLRNWVREARFRDVTRQIGIAMSAYTCMLIPSVMVAATVYAFASALHVSSPLDLRDGIQRGSPAVVLLALALTCVTSMFGGYIAAWLDRRAPIVGALGFGVTFATVQVVAGFFDGRAPIWYRMVVPALFAAGAFAGGLLRATTHSGDSQVVDG